MLEGSRVSHMSAIFKPDVQLIEFEFNRRAYYAFNHQGQEMFKPDAIPGSYCSRETRGLNDPH
jgi:hypothetical protein